MNYFEIVMTIVALLCLAALGEINAQRTPCHSRCCHKD